MSVKEYSVEKIGDKYTVIRKEKTLFGVKERFISSVAYEYCYDAHLWFGTFNSRPDFFSMTGNTFNKEEEASSALAVCIRLQA